MKSIAGDYTRIAKLTGGDREASGKGLAVQFRCVDGKYWWVFLSEDAAVDAAEKMLDKLPDPFYPAELEEELKREQGSREHADVLGRTAALLSLGVGRVSGSVRDGEMAVGLNFKLLAQADEQLCFALPLENANFLAFDLVAELSRRGHEFVCQ